MATARQTSPEPVTPLPPDTRPMPALDPCALPLGPEIPPHLTTRGFPLEECAAAVSPDCGYRLVRAALESARRELLVAVSVISAPHLIELLRDCLLRGVRVRVMTNPADSTPADRAALASLLGAECGVTSADRSVSPRRQKFCVIDGESVLIGSANWTATALPPVVVPGAFRKGSREWVVWARGAEVAGWFRSLFETEWNASVGLASEDHVPSAEPPPILVPAAAVTRPPRVFDVGHFAPDPSARVTPIVSSVTYHDTVRGLIRAATRSIRVQQPYVLGGGSDVDELLAELAFRKDDVEIRILLSPAFRNIGCPDHWDRSLDSLRRHGLADRVRALNLRSFTHCHTRGLVFDCSTAVVSPTSWSEESVARSREAGLVLAARPVAEYFAAVFDTDWASGVSPADLPRDLSAVALESLFRPGGFQAIHPADLV